MSATPHLGRIAVLRTLAGWQRTLRLTILLAPALVLAAGAIDAGRVSPPVAIGLMLLAATCALMPDGNVGVLTVLLLAWHWGATVDRPTSGATLLAAVGVLLFHAAMAAATVAPPAARWSRAMRQRWARRTAVVAATTAAAWGVARLLGSARLEGSAVVLSTTLLAVATGALWIRYRSLPRNMGDMP